MNTAKCFTKILVLLAAVLLCALLLPGRDAQAASSGTCGVEGDGSNLTWTLDDAGTLTISGTGEMKNYDYPDCGPWGKSIKTVVIESDVTSIGGSAFCGCSSLTSVTIPDSVTSIGNSAFYGCSRLTSVTIPDSVTSIGGSAFKGTALYEDEDNWENDLLYIGKQLIVAKNSPSGAYAIREGTKTIADHAFYNFSVLTSVTIPDSVTSIGKYAFYCCSGLTSVTIPDSVTSIGNCAFSGCSGLTSVHITDLAAWCAIEFGIDSNPLYYAHKLYMNGEEVADLVIPDGVTSIENYAFEGCSGLTSVTIPDSVTSIGNCAFSGCSGLTSVTIPDSVTSIGSYAFYYCSSLASVTIPDSVTSIWYYAFDGCSGLTDVYYGGNFIEWPSVSIAYGNSALNNAVLHFLDPVAAGDCGEGVRFEANTDTGVLTISGEGAVTSTPWTIAKRYLQNVTTGEGVTTLPAGAFSGCENLRHVSLGEDVEELYAGGYSWNPSGVFNGCPLLKTAGPAGGGYDFEYAWTRSIPANAFAGMAELESVVLPENLLKLGGYAFFGCAALKKLVLPGKLESIGSSVVSGCVSLDSLGQTGSGCAIEIPWKEPFLGAFLKSNANLKRVLIPTSVTSIGNMAFYNCSGLTEITIPGGVTSIGYSAFYGCTSLEELSLPRGLSSLGNGAFQNCAGLKKVVLRESLATLGTNTFSGCGKLKEIYLPRSLKTVSQDAFNGCEKLNDVYFAGSEAEWAAVAVTELGNGFFTTASFHYNTPAPDDPTPVVVPGDLSGDGVLELNDVMAFFTVISDPAAANTAAMDVNNDGQVNSRDALLLFRRVATKG